MKFEFKNQQLESHELSEYFGIEEPKLNEFKKLLQATYYSGALDATIDSSIGREALEYFS